MSELRLLKIALPLFLLGYVSVATAQPQSEPSLDGKLFTSPEQRAYLDYLRQDFLAKNQEAGFNIEENQIPDIPVDGPDSPAGPTEYTLGGIMSRADGRMTIWLNNRPLTEDQLPTGARLVRDGNTLALRFSNDGRTQLLRPGQTIEVGSGSVQERYQRMPEPIVLEAAPAAANGTSDAAEAAPEADAPATTTEAEDDSTVSPSADGSTAEATADDPLSILKTLPTGILENAGALETIIQSLQAKRDALSEAEDDE